MSGSGHHTSGVRAVIEHLPERFPSLDHAGNVHRGELAGALLAALDHNDIDREAGALLLVQVARHCEVVDDVVVVVEVEVERRHFASAVGDTAALLVSDLTTNDQHGPAVGLERLKGPQHDRMVDVIDLCAAKEMFLNVPIEGG
jgi:hypothetical protein